MQKILIIPNDPTIPAFNCWISGRVIKHHKSFIPKNLIGKLVAFETEQNSMPRYGIIMRDPSGEVYLADSTFFHSKGIKGVPFKKIEDLTREGVMNLDQLKVLVEL